MRQDISSGEHARSIYRQICPFPNWQRLISARHYRALYQSIDPLFFSEDIELLKTAIEWWEEIEQERKQFLFLKEDIAGRPEIWLYSHQPDLKRTHEHFALKCSGELEICAILPRMNAMLTSLLDMGCAIRLMQVDRSSGIIDRWDLWSQDPHRLLRSADSFPDLLLQIETNLKASGRLTTHYSITGH